MGRCCLVIARCAAGRRRLIVAHCATGRRCPAIARHAAMGLCASILRRAGGVRRAAAGPTVRHGAFARRCLAVTLVTVAGCGCPDIVLVAVRRI